MRNCPIGHPEISAIGKCEDVISEKKAESGSDSSFINKFLNFLKVGNVNLHLKNSNKFKFHLQENLGFTIAIDPLGWERDAKLVPLAGLVPILS